MTLALTCGDPAGIGPEVAVRAAALLLKRSPQLRLKFYGPREVWSNAAELVGLPPASQKKLLGNVVVTPGDVVPYGRDSRSGGLTTIAAIDAAIGDAKAGRVRAIVTAPTSKTSLHLAGYALPGQTEYFAAQTRCRKFAMMLAGPSLRVVLVTTHLALKDAIAALSIGGVTEKIIVAHTALSVWLGRPPRLALCALNPHAGEGGKFGSEEASILLPAVKRAKKMGAHVVGPLPSDTLFYHARRGDYDAVVCLFHDQGLIPLKMLHFDEGVNVTLGLPFVRTSPDHGTAFDIAGTGTARASSMLAAITLARRYAAKQRPGSPRSQQGSSR